MFRNSGFVHSKSVQFSLVTHYVYFWLRPNRRSYFQKGLFEFCRPWLKALIIHGPGFSFYIFAHNVQLDAPIIFPKGLSDFYEKGVRDV